MKEAHYVEPSFNIITTLYLAVPVAEYKFSQFYVSQFSNLVTSSIQVLHGTLASSQLCPFFFCATLCSFLQSNCCLLNCSQFSSVDVAVIKLYCQLIDPEFTMVRNLLFVSFWKLIIVLLGAECAS